MFLDFIFAPRDWCVVRLLGTIAASNNEHWLPNDEDIIRNNITRSHALRLARKLRQQAEDRPETVVL